MGLVLLKNVMGNTGTPQRIRFLSRFSVDVFVVNIEVQNVLYLSDLLIPYRVWDCVGYG